MFGSRQLARDLALAALHRGQFLHQPVLDGRGSFQGRGQAFHLRESFGGLSRHSTHGLEHSGDAGFLRDNFAFITQSRRQARLGPFHTDAQFGDL
jgi:hypothetical protein